MNTRNHDNPAMTDPQGWDAAAALIGAEEDALWDKCNELDAALTRTRALLRSISCLILESDFRVDDVIELVECAKETLEAKGEEPLDFVMDFRRNTQKAIYDHLFPKPQSAPVAAPEDTADLAQQQEAIQADITKLLTEAVRPYWTKADSVGENKPVERAAKRKSKAGKKEVH
ncbi:MAG: hypothetical protein JSR83_10120 [Proteobacteria bacterium]|nr:hypothetical protein [Pseudomonadota bacterium]